MKLVLVSTVCAGVTTTVTVVLFAAVWCSVALYSTVDLTCPPLVGHGVILGFCMSAVWRRLSWIHLCHDCVSTGWIPRNERMCILVWNSCQIVVHRGWTVRTAVLLAGAPVSPHPRQEVGYQTSLLACLRGGNDISYGPVVHFGGRLSISLCAREHQECLLPRDVLLWVL